MLVYKCPKCGSQNLRRSAVKNSEISLRHFLVSPYRCRNCNYRFWRISRSVRQAVAAIIAVGGIAVTVAVLVNHSRRMEQQNTQIVVKTNTQQLATLLVQAEGGDVGAQFRLAMMYWKGTDVPQDDSKSVKWLQSAARRDHVDAQYYLGLAYREGRGVLQDYREAMKWFRKVAEAGKVEAQYQLGVMYRKGQGVPLDNVKAYIWFNIAAAQGNQEAAFARDSITSFLTTQEIAEAQIEARGLLDKYGRHTEPAG